MKGGNGKKGFKDIRLNRGGRNESIDRIKEYSQFCHTNHPTTLYITFIMCDKT